MRIVIDLQGAQCGSRHRGIGRYSLALAQAMVQNRGDHEIIIALNGLFPETIEPMRAAFNEILPQENIRVWHAHGPVHAFDSENTWRRHTAELIREAFLASLQPDIVHISSLIEGFGDNAVHSIGLLPVDIPTAATFYDVIPLIQSEIYLTPHKVFEVLYREKLSHLSHANLYLAISESSRSEVVEHLDATYEQSVNIAAAADDFFKPLEISYVNQQAIRKHFGLTRPFVMYSGATDERKNHLRLIKAFSILPLNLKKRYQLAIVGGLPPQHRKSFENYIKLCGLSLDDVVITGRVSDDEMVRLYNLCDLFVFPSWHEGFGLPALEAMSCGAPVIASNTTSLPEVIGREDALFDPFDEKSISQKMADVLLDDVFRKNLAKHGLERAKIFSWDESAKRAIRAFERFYATESRKKNFSPNHVGASELVPLLIENIAKLGKPSVNQYDWLMTAQAIAQNHDTSQLSKLLVDVSQLVRVDSKTGIQRVVRGVLTELLANPPKNFRIELVYAIPGEPGYRYARQFVQRFFNQPEKLEEDNLVDVFGDDVFLGLDFQPYVVSEQASFFAELKHIGARVYFVVYDLLPALSPEFFPEDAYFNHVQWLNTIAQTDGVLCISRAVADDMKEWLTVFGPNRLRPFKLGWFHLGIDVTQSVPTENFPPNASHELKCLSSRPTFLCVGTIEPRKGQMQTVEAFERLWEQGFDINLVFVGKLGWNVDLLSKMLLNHSERNHRLFWLDGVSDEYLEKIYATSTCLIAASEGEGFGLPLIEAAHHKKPIIARDIPVFREVAGEHALYFSGLEPEALAGAVRDWLVLDKVFQAPQSDTMPWLTWKQSTKNLLDVILGDQWYQLWMPDDVHRYWGGDSRLGTQVGQRKGRDIVCTNQAGYLIFGPYMSLDSGNYMVKIRGEIGVHGVAGARMDVAVDKGQQILGESFFGKIDEDGYLISLMISLDSSCTDLEIRVWVNNDNDLKVSMISIEPWNVKEDTDAVA